MSSLAKKLPVTESEAMGRTLGEPIAPPKDGPVQKGGPVLIDESSEHTNRLAAITLSPAVSTGLQPNTPYVLKDESGRTLCWNQDSSAWGWAFVGDYETYGRLVNPIYFSQDPMTGSPLVMVTRNSNDALFANGKSTNWEWTFWGDSSWDGSRPKLSVKAELTDSPTRYRLSYLNGNTVMNLAADAGSWNWLYISSSASPARFTIHKFYVDRSKLADLLHATWPSSDFDLRSYKTFGDRFYEAIDDAQATATYRRSGLDNYHYRVEVFDCDDFSYVYKAQASKDAYATVSEFGYAVGVIFGRTSTTGHAVNVFVDPKGRVRILEPQNGTIVPGAEWKNKEGEKYNPQFVLV